MVTFSLKGLNYQFLNSFYWKMTFETYSNMMSFVRSVLHRMKKGKEERKATNWDDEDLLIVIIFFIDSDKHHLAREL